jgi:hypothetical protein
MVYPISYTAPDAARHAIIRICGRVFEPETKSVEMNTAVCLGPLVATPITNESQGDPAATDADYPLGCDLASLRDFGTGLRIRQSRAEQ